MQHIFPCGAKGSANFCPTVCQYGKFCKIKEKKDEKPRGLTSKELLDERPEELNEKDFEIEFY